ncbi:MAG TPA: hypothetical protein VFT65_10620, partial [Candidatus Angelobacter sp.]|nr:hypothetical protein [Candidatus Angelobacter sp.]
RSSFRLSLHLKAEDIISTPFAPDDPIQRSPSLQITTAMEFNAPAEVTVLSKLGRVAGPPKSPFQPSGSSSKFILLRFICSVP